MSIASETSMPIGSERPYSPDVFFDAVQAVVALCQENLQQTVGFSGPRMIPIPGRGPGVSGASRICSFFLLFSCSFFFFLALRKILFASRGDCGASGSVQVTHRVWTLFTSCSF